MLAREQSVATFLTLEHMLRLAIAMASSSQPTDIDTFTSTPYSILLRHVAIKMFIANCRKKISFLSIFILLRHVAIKPCDSSQYFLFEDFSYSRTYAKLVPLFYHLLIPWQLPRYTLKICQSLLKSICVFLHFHLSA